MLTPFGLHVYECTNKPTPKQVFSPKQRAEGAVILFTCSLCCLFTVGINKTYTLQNPFFLKKEKKKEVWDPSTKATWALGKYCRVLWGQLWIHSSSSAWAQQRFLTSSVKHLKALIEPWAGCFARLPPQNQGNIGRYVTWSLERCLLLFKYVIIKRKWFFAYSWESSVFGVAWSDLAIKVNARLPAVCWNSGLGNANSLASTFKGHCAWKK